MLTGRLKKKGAGTAEFRLLFFCFDGLGGDGRLVVEGDMAVGIDGVVPVYQPIADIPIQRDIYIHVICIYILMDKMPQAF